MEQNLNNNAGFSMPPYHIYKALNFKEFYGFKDDFGPRRAGA